MGDEELNLEEGEKKVIREKTMEALVEEVICEYDEVTKKAISEMSVEVLPL